LNARRPGLWLPFWLLAGWTFLTSDARAVADDEGPIHVVTREAIRDEVTGSTILLGDVTFRQGSLEITADEVTLERVVKEGDRVSASGSPATVRQQSPSGGEPIYAEAGRILYQRPLSKLQLFDAVLVQQGNTTMRCDRVDYLMAREYLRAFAGSGQRVETIIPPERVQSIRSEGRLERD
jgi:lipopolysaccharide transport protein LptA